ncbi:MAG: Hsp20/alpha crystallin family protein [Acidimicrobiales bacterium]
MLTPFDPVRELDRMASTFFGNTGGASAGRMAAPMDVVRGKDAVTVHFDLPGVEPDSVELSVEKNRLILKTERRLDVGEGENVLSRGRFHGELSRELFLSDNLDPSKAQAEFHNGVLTVRIPVAETAQPRKISIERRNQITADASAN